jgi:hypothetical protein
VASGPAGSWYTSARGLGDALFDLARRYPEGTLQVELVTAHGQSCPVKGKALQRLALAAWCEVRGIAVPSDDELRQKRKARESRRQLLRADMLADLRGGPEGVERWNRRTPAERAEVREFRRVDLKGAQLAKASFRGGSRGGLDFTGAIFDGADLRKASLDSGLFCQASFKGADLSGASLAGASLTGANFEGATLVGCYLRNIRDFREVSFQNADLRKAHFGDSDLSCADLSSANLDGARFADARHDDTTRFPVGFVLPQGQPARPADLEVGTRVRVTSGAFEGLEGDVKELLEEAGKVRVELTIFGRAVTVELEYDQVMLA